MALARGEALLGELSEELPVVAYGAELSAAGVVLGAYQHAPHALRTQAFEALALPLSRRATGGVALWVSPGVLYVALGLLHSSVLMTCPPGRILNRNVRGLLAGIRSLGVPAYYFGRDFVSAGSGPSPAIFVGWDERGDGRVLLEFFVALETSFALPEELSGYPPRSTPQWGGKPIAPLRALLPQAKSTEQVLLGIAEGYARAFGVAFERQAPGAASLARALELAPQLRVDPNDDGALRWSRPHEEAIGFVSAGVRVDAQGRFAALELRGDFYQQRACTTRLSDALCGAPTDSGTISAALDDVYRSPGSLEGIRSLTTLRDAISNAAGV